jgi:hypothetical protein
MRGLRPKQVTAELAPGVQSLEAWLQANRAKYAEHFA